VRARDILTEFDRYLGAYGYTFEGLVAGSAALDLLGVLAPRQPVVEIVYPELPDFVAERSEEFALARALSPTWLRHCGDDTVHRLPRGWADRLRIMSFTGRSIFLHCLSRPDLIAGRLLALLEGRARLDECLVLGLLPGDLRRSREFLLEQHDELSWQRDVEEMLHALALYLHNAQPERHGQVDGEGPHRPWSLASLGAGIEALTGRRLNES